MQTEIPDPYKLELGNSDVQETVYSELCRIVEESVSACYDRDSELRMFRWQLEGYSQPNTNEPWPGACQIESTISRELHTTSTAAIWSGARQTPYVCIESMDPDGVDRASQTETYLNLKAQQFGFDKALYDIIYLANEGRYSVLYQGVDQKIQRYFTLEENEQEVEVDGEIVPEPTEPTVMLTEEPKDFCIKYRVPDPWDFYVFPVNARGPQEEDGAILTIERMYLTREDLSLGVLQEGFRAKSVEEMISRGPAQLSSEANQEREDEYVSDGIQSANTDASRDGGMWECFQVIGRMPYCPDEDGDPRIPENLWHVDCLWMICPALKCVFKQAYSPSPEGVRPYTIFNIIDKPNRMLGEGICSMIAPVHEEMTAIERFGINNMNLEASPVMTVAESWLTRYSKYKIAPGRFFPRQSGDPIGPKPLQWDVNSQHLIMPWLQQLDAQANRLAASQGANSALAGRVRKAAEVHFAEGMQQTKFDLFLSNIQRGVVKAFEITRRLLLQHMDDQGDTAYSMGQSVNVQPQVLEGDYRFFAQAASDSLTPAARLARQQAISEIVNAYWLGVQQWMMLGCLSYMWHLNHRLLILAGERSPERYLGPEPPPSNPMMNPMAMAGALPGQAPGMAGMMALPGQSPGGNGGNGGAPPTPNFGAEGMAGAGMLQASALSPHRNGAS